MGELKSKMKSSSPATRAADKVGQQYCLKHEKWFYEECSSCKHGELLKKN